MSENKELKNGKVAFHPGYYIKEYLEYRNITSDAFAISVEINKEDIDNIIKGKKDITDDIAFKLSKKIETSKTYWLNLQKTFN